jgi:hypothetical protein
MDPDPGGPKTSGSGSPTLAGRIGDLRWTNPATGKKHDLSFTFSCLFDGIFKERRPVPTTDLALLIPYMSTVDESDTAVSYQRNRSYHFNVYLSKNMRHNPSNF